MEILSQMLQEVGLLTLGAPPFQTSVIVLVSKERRTTTSILECCVLVTDVHNGSCDLYLATIIDARNKTSCSLQDTALHSVCQHHQRVHATEQVSIVLLLTVLKLLNSMFGVLQNTSLR